MREDRGETKKKNLRGRGEKGHNRALGMQEDSGVLRRIVVERTEGHKGGWFSEHVRRCSSSLVLLMAGLSHLWASLEVQPEGVTGITMCPVVARESLEN